jgi:hypothetical protein
MTRSGTFGAATIAVVIAALAILLTAATASATANRAEYVAQVDPICAHELAGAKRTLGGVNGDLVKGRYKQAGVKFARANNVFKKGVNNVAAVSPPSADAALIDQWVQMLSAQIPLAARASKVLKHEAPRAKVIRAIRRLFRVSDETQALVSDYGFTSCNEM